MFAPHVGLRLFSPQSQAFSLCGSDYSSQFCVMCKMDHSWTAEINRPAPATTNSSDRKADQITILPLARLFCLIFE
ncbi:hypothetical protein RRG08_012559 [Elysia crispata]|uniref:Uncharacterized protein n=1 Tax=Elysia crispata TaxID=231223 RepID=A0AAE1AP23_9GAST|nr:hypothetical protein RRG08_012559 [Elysia crispata]